MRIIIDILHPAHVHLFKNFIFYLKKNKHLVIVTARNKDVSKKLLDYYNIDYILLTNAKKGTIPLGLELLNRDYKILGLHNKYHFNAAFGTSISISHLSFLKKVDSFHFQEDDDDVISLWAMLTYPFTTKIIVPSCLRYKRWNKKRVTYNSYHELAYLHPNNYKSDKSVLKKYNLEPRKYILIRNSALKAYHDWGAKGLEKNVWDKIHEIVRDFPLIYSKEFCKNHQIEPWDMHSVISFAKMVISDSQTMTAEAAVLGVPAVRYNSFVGRISYLEELEKSYGLTYGFKPGQEKELIKKINELLHKENLSEEWKKRRQKMLSEKVDFNRWMIKFFEKESITQ